MKLVLNIGTVDDRCFKYYNLCLEYLMAITDMVGLGSIGLYGADNRRTELHERIINETGVDRERFQEIINHLDKTCYLELEPNYYIDGHIPSESAVLLANHIWKLLNVAPHKAKH